MKLNKVKYKNLNAKQKESFNYYKVASILADYGFSSMWLNDDWQGADFIAIHVDGETFMKVQLKSRLTLDKKYLNKDIFIVFRENSKWYLYLHDELLNLLISKGYMVGSKSWKKSGSYSWPSIPHGVAMILDGYEI